VKKPLNLDPDRQNPPKRKTRHKTWGTKEEKMTLCAESGKGIDGLSHHETEGEISKSQGGKRSIPP